MILEDVISQLVIKKVWKHIHKLIVDEYVANGSIAQLEENIRYAQSKSYQDFTIREGLTPPDENALKIISKCFKSLEMAVLPFEKLEHLISIITVILTTVQTRNPGTDSVLLADELLSLIMWSVVKCDARSIELDAVYMWGLLHPSLTSGECGCHLNALCGALQMLKGYKSMAEGDGSLTAVTSQPPLSPPFDRPSSARCSMTLEEYALHLAADKTTFFAQSVDNFVRDTVESPETNASVVMRYARQFVTGMKNYLINLGEKEFQLAAENECSRWSTAEFLTLDVILDGVVSRLVFEQLRDHVYSLLVDKHVADGSIPSIVENIHYAKSKTIQDFAAQDNLIPPNEDDLKEILDCFKRLQVAFSPSEKLDHLLAAVTLIVNTVKMRNPNGVYACEADDFLPLLAWVLVRCNVVTAELEAEYIEGLLHPSLMTGEGGYYLTTLCAAVQVVRSHCSSVDAEMIRSHNTLNYDPLNELKSVLKVVVVSDETDSSVLVAKMLPVGPLTTARDVCEIVARKLSITDPENYSLFKLIDGQEFLLTDTDCPCDIKSSTTAYGTHCLFLFKRNDGQITWSPT